METEPERELISLKVEPNPSSEKEEKRALNSLGDVARYDGSETRIEVMGKKYFYYVKKLEKDIEMLQFQNDRLSKRIEAMMKKQNTSAFGWLAPTSIVSGLFGPSKDLRQDEIHLLQEHFSRVLEERAFEEDEYKNSLALLNQRLNAAQSEIRAKDKEIEVLKKKLSLSQKGIRQVQKDLAETLIKNESLENRLLEIRSIVEQERKDQIEKEEKYAMQVQELSSKALLHEEFAKIGVSPTKALALAQQRGDKVLYEDPGLIEENLFKLKAEMLSILSRHKKEHSENGKAEGALSDSEEEFERKLRALEPESDTDQLHDFLKILECPYRCQVSTYKLFLEESKKKIKELEIKERALNKMMTSSFKCPSCAFKFVLTRKRAP